MNFLTGLETFRKNCGLENETGDIVTNILEEVVEVRKAYRAHDIDNLVEESCDICVYCFNGIAQLGESDIKYTKGAEINAMDYMCLEMLTVINSIFVNRIATSDLYHIIHIVSGYIESIGYDFELAMNETVKKINSREGAMNELTSKWEKNKNQCASTLYFPNYEVCRK